MFGFRKKKRTLKSGTIKKEPSYMMAIPKNINKIENMDKIVRRLESNELFITRSIEDMKNTSLTLKIYYKGNNYTANIILESYELGEICKLRHYLNEEDYKSVVRSRRGITVAMMFNESILDSYHLQLKILHTIMPDMAGTIDFSCGKILSGKWIRLAARSEVSPSTEYIYSIETVNEKNIYWLYTQGLKRCGVIDLEILKSDNKNFKSHRRILKMLVQKIILTNEFIDEEQPYPIGKMSNGNEIVITWISPEEAVKYYNREIPGGAEEREEMYKEDTGVIYVYVNKFKHEQKKYSHISSINKYIKKDLVVMLTNEEIDRNSTLAMERINYFIEGMQHENVRGLMEIGIEIENYASIHEIAREHLWFNIKEIDKVSAIGILSQEPHYRKDLRVGTELEFLVEHLTDWVLYTKHGKVTPDSVYLLEEKQYWFDEI